LTLKITKTLAIFILFLGVGFSMTPTIGRRANSGASLSDYERMTLDVCRSIVVMFKTEPSAVWPGYDLAEQTYLVYIPKKWVLLFNPTGPVEGFSSCPKEWPDLGTKVLYHEGSYGDLIGQLVFDFEIAGVKTVAIGLPEDPQGLPTPRDVHLAGFIAHEAFHQFQAGHFGEIPWQREERYPILDQNNTALACLEMKLLMDAVSRSEAGARPDVEDLLRMFVAVRAERWRAGEAFVAGHEQGLEIREGTARYVEMKALSLIKNAAGLPGFASLSFPGQLKEDFLARFSGETVSPEDMPRNRIYPVGAALGYLCDFLGLDWKPSAQAAGPEFAFHLLLSKSLGASEVPAEGLVARAKETYGYENILKATGKLIGEYQEGFSREFEAFNRQPLERLEVEFSYRGISRSRGSLGKTWLVDNGSKSLCRRYRVYTLKNADLLLQIQDAGVYEENDWDAKHKKVVFYVPSIESLALNGETVGKGKDISGPFRELEIKGPSVKLEITKPGTISRKGRTIAIKIAETTG
jgi:hypothetical protein